MKCPHCRVEFHSNLTWLNLGKDADGHWAVVKQVCPACGRMVVMLATGEPSFTAQQIFIRIHKVDQSYLVRPKSAGRPPCPAEVPKDVAEDYREACLVFSDSPKASAALSRRCLQHLLRDYAKVKASNLASKLGNLSTNPASPLIFSKWSMRFEISGTSLRIQSKRRRQRVRFFLLSPARLSGILMS